MTDMTLDLAAGASVRTSLEDDVRSAGLPIISGERVKAHMKEKVAEDCPTLVSKFINIVTHVFGYLNLRLLFKYVLPERSMTSHRLLALATSAILLIISIPVVLLTSNFQWFALSIPAITWITSGVYAWFAMDFIQISTGTLTWERHTLSSFGKNNIPKRLHDRIEQAQNIPNAKVMILADSDVDPFVVIQRGFSLWKEEVPCGAWSTHSDMDEI